MGSCEVVGVRVGRCVLVRICSSLLDVVGVGGVLRAVARSTLGVLAAGTLGSGAAGIRGRSTLGDGVTVVGGDGVMVVVGGAGIFCRSDGRRISRSCWMAWDRATDSLVEDGTVPPRAVSVSVAWMIVRSVSEIFGVVQCVG